VVLHARLAEEQPADERWSIDDVAGDLVAKMVRRNPHVFGDTTVDSIDDIVDAWERIKQAEKSRESVMDGIALTQPALALAAKVLSRARRGGVDLPSPAPPPVVAEDEAALGAALLAIVAAAQDRGLDPEGSLRRAALAHADAVRAAERPALPS
jgi:XTP/dITP diphosphohydrolase